jgi:aspartate-semialdehyde dehydrogenase
VGRSWSVGIVGVTGAVGRTMVRCLEEIALPISSLRGFASPRSVGAMLDLGGARERSIEIEPLEEGRLDGFDLVLLSAGGDVSRAWTQRIVDHGAWAVDNSSALRREPKIPLVVPEVNAGTIPARRCAIANPNCSTIQLVVVLAPIAREFGLRSVHVATYQSVSGRGQKGIDALAAERAGRDPGREAFPHGIDRNVIPQCDLFLDDGFTREEDKMIFETRRILAMPDLAVHPTCVRVPVEVGHSEAVHVELQRAVERDEITACLARAPGVRILDEPTRQLYPTARETAGSNDVWVGRIRRDRANPRIVEMWIVSDNLRKGAAWNAVQIASLLHARETGNAGLPPSD